MRGFSPRNLKYMCALARAWPEPEFVQQPFAQLPWSHVALTRHITRFLLELGAGFASVGRQYRLDVGEDEFFIDLLFYHLKLRYYVVVELKTTPSRPEYAGQRDFYLPAIDAQVKAPEDQRTIGLLLTQ
jgi:YhcG PDDEXK nuclease domain